MKWTLSCIHHLFIVSILYSKLSVSTFFPWQNLIFPAFQRILSDEMLQSSAVSLCLTASGLQQQIYLYSELALFRGRTSIRFVSAASASPFCFLPLWVGPGYWIVSGFVLAGNLFSFFLSALKSWPIYSNPIIIEAWLSRVIDGTLLKLGYCWHTCYSYCFSCRGTD